MENTLEKCRNAAFRSHYISYVKLSQMDGSSVGCSVRNARNVIKDDAEDCSTPRAPDAWEPTARVMYHDFALRTTL